MKKIYTKMKNNDGFTLIEMAIVILIIAMLLLIIIPNIGKVEESASKTTGEAIEQTIETQKIMYRIDNNKTPGSEVSLQNLVNDGYITKEQQKLYENRN